MSSSSPARKISILGTIVPAIALLSAWWCTPVQQGVIQQCKYTLSANWPSGPASFDTENQARCPIYVPPGGRNQSYYATAILPSGSTSGNAGLEFSDYNNNYLGQGEARMLSPDFYLFTGSYRAGTIQVSAPSIGYDVARNSVALSVGGIATVSANLGYQSTASAAVLGSNTVDPGMMSTLTGEYYQSDLIPPVTYQWFQDGGPITGAVDTTLAVYGGAPNSSSLYAFTVTDAQGRSVSASRLVVTTDGCGTLLQC